LDTTTAQNEQRKNRRLTLPVLAIDGSGYWLAEQAPEELLAALTEFLAPYREGGGGTLR
jgi:hypothetical protein